MESYHDILKNQTKVSFRNGAYFNGSERMRIRSLRIWFQTQPCFRDARYEEEMIWGLQCSGAGERRQAVCVKCRFHMSALSVYRQSLGRKDFLCGLCTLHQA